MAAYQLHASGLHLGYLAQERAISPYAPFFKSDLAPLPRHVQTAVLTGAQAHELFPSVDHAGDMQASGYWPVETGYTLTPDGAARVFVLTDMPDVTPAMWDWWFAWHGDEALRYKLWHPQAHVHAVWADGQTGLNHYVGRTSRVVEYIGAQRLALTIRFVRPSLLGLDEALLKQRGETAICARGGLAGTPLETGWLVHHIRPVAGGCEMRSRFWIGGRNVCLRGMPGGIGQSLGQWAARLQSFSPHQAADLMVHCAQEMSHLAAILPDLYATFSHRSAR